MVGRNKKMNNDRQQSSVCIMSFHLKKLMGKKKKTEVVIDSLSYIELITLDFGIRLKLQCPRGLTDPPNLIKIGLMVEENKGVEKRTKRHDGSIMRFYVHANQNVPWASHVHVCPLFFPHFFQTSNRSG